MLYKTKHFRYCSTWKFQNFGLKREQYVLKTAKRILKHEAKGQDLCYEKRCMVHMARGTPGTAV